ncbi:hypothetical protein B296_00057047 [Ensete ventricosum]|uniref:Uncharacterized protein n=1 Tax=Ensete ventricosum TaxID=4639 RepID=A0A426X8F2_ENSVE|nr:hypothetical protein B296_00057047 [Ensete ventricosum]
MKEKGREKKTVTHRRSIGGGRRSNEGLQAAGHAVPVAACSATGEPERSGGDDKANDHQHTSQLSSSCRHHQEKRKGGEESLPLPLYTRNSSGRGKSAESLTNRALDGVRTAGGVLSEEKKNMSRRGRM